MCNNKKWKIIDNDKGMKCYRCGSRKALLVEEIYEKNTDKLLGKNFICLTCSQLRDYLRKTE
jgi:DNA-directed RNA polymerase subunit RPC12/RpoP